MAPHEFSVILSATTDEFNVLSRHSISQSANHSFIKPIYQSVSQSTAPIKLIRYSENKTVFLENEKWRVQCSICRGGGVNPLWCHSTSQVLIDSPKNSQKIKKIHCWLPSGFTTNLKCDNVVVFKFELIVCTIFCKFWFRRADARARPVPINCGKWTVNLLTIFTLCTNVCNKLMKLN